MTSPKDVSKCQKLSACRDILLCMSGIIPMEGYGWSGREKNALSFVTIVTPLPSSLFSLLFARDPINICKFLN